MTQVVLIQATPADPSTGKPVEVRLAGGGSRAYDQFNFTNWRGGVATLPRFTAEIGFDANGWNGNAIPQASAIRFFSHDQQLTNDLAGLYWKGARISIITGDDETGAYSVAFAGAVASAPVDGGVITYSLGDLTVDLNKPLLTDTFAGTGGIEGAEDIDGRIKRRTWGFAFNIEGLILDKVNNVYEFGDPGRPLNAFVRVKDKGREGPIEVLAWQGSAAATFAALQAIAAPVGGGVAAPSIACVKWWTVASGPLTADIRGEEGAGYVDTAAEVIERVVAAKTSIPVLDVPAFAGYRPATIGVHVDSSSETIAQILDRIAQGVSLLWIMSPVGAVLLRRWEWIEQTGEPYRSLNVTSRTEVLAPIKSRKLGYQRNHRVQTAAEISSAILATDVTYSDGDTVDSFKPATPNADNTATSATGETVTSALNADGTVKDDKVTTPAIAASAVQQTLFSRVTTDLSVDQNTIATVASLTFTKQETDSDVKVTFSGMFWSADDVQFNCSVIVDGSTSFVAGQQNLIFDGSSSAAKATISPFVYLSLGVGSHTIGFQVQNVENDNIPLIVKAGSALEVLEIKQGAQ